MTALNLQGGLLERVYVNNFRGKHVTETLAAQKVLTEKSPMIQLLDNGGAVRDVLLPPEADSEGLIFIIANTGGGAFAITVKEDSDTTTIVTLDQAQAGIVFCDGTTWFGFIGGIT